MAKLQRASLRSPVRIEIGTKYSTVDTLMQHYIFCPFAQKDANLVSIVNEQTGSSILIFTRTVHDATRLAIMLRTLVVFSMSSNTFQIVQIMLEEDPIDWA